MDQTTAPIGSNEQGKSPTMREFNWLMGIVIAVVVVCGLGFITLLFSYFSQNTSAYEELKSQIAQQNAKLDALYATCYLARPIK